MTDATTIRENDNPRPRASRPRRLVSVVLSLFLVVPLLTAGTGILPASGADSLSAALARQAQLKKLITAQKLLLAKLAAEQKVVNGAIADTNSALRAVNADLSAVQSRIGKLSVQIKGVQADYDSLVAQVKELDAQIVQTQAQEDDKAAELAQRKTILAARLRAAYSSQQTSVLETILTASSFADALTNVGHLLDFGAADERIAAQIKEDQATLATLHQTLDESRAATEALRVQVANQKKELAARLSDQAAAKKKLASLQAITASKLAIQQKNYAKLAKNKAAAAKTIKELEAAMEALANKIAALVKAGGKNGTIPSAYSGTLAWPMVGTVTQNFGCTGFSWEPAVGGCSHFHRGIDIAAPMYTPVRASGDGRVVFAGANPYDPSPKAWIVIIAHSETLQTWYAHLDNGSHSIPVRAGQWVTKGQVIGYEGMTGHTTGPHLHWAVVKNGTWTNPRLFL